NIVCGNSLSISDTPQRALVKATTGEWSCSYSSDNGSSAAQEDNLLYSKNEVARGDVSDPSSNSLGFPTTPSRVIADRVSKDDFAWLKTYPETIDFPSVYPSDNFYETVFTEDASQDDIEYANALAELSSLTRVVRMPTLGVQGSGDSENMLYTYNLLYSENSFELGPLSDLAPNRLTVVTSSSCADACSALVLGVQ
ncbi:hypothetical protein KIPB_010994, partial [Kipferlia bialata]